MVNFDQVIVTVSSYWVIQTYLLDNFYTVSNDLLGLEIPVHNFYFTEKRFSVCNTIHINVSNTEKIYSKYIVQWAAFVNWFEDCKRAFHISYPIDLKQDVAAECHKEHTRTFRIAEYV